MQANIICRNFETALLFDQYLERDSDEEEDSAEDPQADLERLGQRYFLRSLAKNRKAGLETLEDMIAALPKPSSTQEKKYLDSDGQLKEMGGPWTYV